MLRRWGGSVWGVCVETCACEVSAGRNIETAEPVIIISHPLTSLPNVWVLSSFVLLPPAAFTFSFTWQAAQQKHQSLFVNVNCRWPNNLGVSESVDCFELNFNVYKPLCSLTSLSTGSSSLSIGHAFLCCYIVITAAVYEVMKGNTCCWNRSTTLSCLPCKSMGNIIKY